MKIEVERMERAQAFWGIAEKGRLKVRWDGVPYLYVSRDEAALYEFVPSHCVRVYLVVEDD